MICIGPILENLWFYIVKSTILQKSTFGIYAHVFGISQWSAPCLKGFWASVFAVFERPLTDCSSARFFINFGRFWSYFSAQNATISVPGGSFKTLCFFVDFRTLFFVCFSSLGPQGGPQEGPKFWVARAFYDILASQSPSRGPVTIFNRFLMLWDRFFNGFSNICWPTFYSFLVDVISILKWMLGSFWQVV